jgi:hypothetical protein
VKAGIPPSKESIATIVSNRINLPASAGICNTLLSGLLAHSTLHFYAESISQVSHKKARKAHQMIFPKQKKLFVPHVPFCG